MRVPLKIESAPTELTGQKPPGRRNYDRQRKRLLPIHEAKIAPKRRHATDEISKVFSFLVAKMAKCGRYSILATASPLFRAM